MPNQRPSTPTCGKCHDKNKTDKLKSDDSAYKYCFLRCTLLKPLSKCSNKGCPSKTESSRRGSSSKLNSSSRKSLNRKRSSECSSICSKSSSIKKRSSNHRSKSEDRNKKKNSSSSICSDLSASSKQKSRNQSRKNSQCSVCSKSSSAKKSSSNQRSKSNDRNKRKNSNSSICSRLSASSKQSSSNRSHKQKKNSQCSVCQLESSSKKTTSNSRPKSDNRKLDSSTKKTRSNRDDRSQKKTSECSICAAKAPCKKSTSKRDFEQSSSSKSRSGDKSKRKSSVCSIFKRSDNSSKKNSPSRDSSADSRQSKGQKSSQCTAKKNCASNTSNRNSAKSGQKSKPGDKNQREESSCEIFVKSDSSNKKNKSNQDSVADSRNKRAKSDERSLKKSSQCNICTEKNTCKNTTSKKNPPTKSSTQKPKTEDKSQKKSSLCSICRKLGSSEKKKKPNKETPKAESKNQSQRKSSQCDICTPEDTCKDSSSDCSIWESDSSGKKNTTDSSSPKSKTNDKSQRKSSLCSICRKLGSSNKKNSSSRDSSADSTSSKSETKTKTQKKSSSCSLCKKLSNLCKKNSSDKDSTAEPSTPESKTKQDSSTKPSSPKSKTKEKRKSSSCSLCKKLSSLCNKKSSTDSKPKSKPDKKSTSKQTKSSPESICLKSDCPKGKENTQKGVDSEPLEQKETKAQSQKQEEQKQNTTNQDLSSKKSPTQPKSTNRTPEKQNKETNFKNESVKNNSQTQTNSAELSCLKLKPNCQDNIQCSIPCETNGALKQEISDKNSSLNTDSSKSKPKEPDPEKQDNKVSTDCEPLKQNTSSPRSSILKSSRDSFSKSEDQKAEDNIDSKSDSISNRDSVTKISSNTWKSKFNNFGKKSKDNTSNTSLKNKSKRDSSSKLSSKESSLKSKPEKNKQGKVEKKLSKETNNKKKSSKNSIKSNDSSSSSSKTSLCKDENCVKKVGKFSYQATQTKSTFKGFCSTIEQCISNLAQKLDPVYCTCGGRPPTSCTCKSYLEDSGKYSEKVGVENFEMYKNKNSPPSNRRISSGSIHSENPYPPSGKTSYYTTKASQFDPMYASTPAKVPQARQPDTIRSQRYNENVDTSFDPSYFPKRSPNIQPCISVEGAALCTTQEICQQQMRMIPSGVSYMNTQTTYQPQSQSTSCRGSFICKQLPTNSENFQSSEYNDPRITAFQPIIYEKQNYYRENEESFAPAQTNSFNKKCRSCKTFYDMYVEDPKPNTSRTSKSNYDAEYNSPQYQQFTKQQYQSPETTPIYKQNDRSIEYMKNQVRRWSSNAQQQQSRRSNDGIPANQIGSTYYDSNDAYRYDTARMQQQPIIGMCKDDSCTPHCNKDYSNNQMQQEPPCQSYNEYLEDQTYDSPKSSFTSPKQQMLNRVTPTEQIPQQKSLTPNMSPKQEQSSVSNRATSNNRIQQLPPNQQRSLSKDFNQSNSKCLNEDLCYKSFMKNQHSQMTPPNQKKTPSTDFNQSNSKCLKEEECYKTYIQNHQSQMSNKATPNNRIQQSSSKQQKTSSTDFNISNSMCLNNELCYKYIQSQLSQLSNRTTPNNRMQQSTPPITSYNLYMQDKQQQSQMPNVSKGGRNDEIFTSYYNKEYSNNQKSDSSQIKDSDSYYEIIEISKSDSKCSGYKACYDQYMKKSGERSSGKQVSDSSNTSSYTTGSTNNSKYSSRIPQPTSRKQQTQDSASNSFNKAPTMNDKHKQLKYPASNSYETGVSKCGSKCIEDAQYSQFQTTKNAAPAKKNYESKQQKIPNDAECGPNCEEHAQYEYCPPQQQYSQIKPSDNSTPIKKKESNDYSKKNDAECEPNCEEDAQYEYCLLKQQYSQFKPSDISTPMKKKESFDHSKKNYQSKQQTSNDAESKPKYVEDKKYENDPPKQQYSQFQSSGATPTKKKDNNGYSQESYQTELPPYISECGPNCIEDEQYENYRSKQEYSQFQFSDATPTKKKDNDYSQESYQTELPPYISECGPNCIEDAQYENYRSKQEYSQFQSSDATPTKKKDNNGYSQESYQTELPPYISECAPNCIEDAQYENYGSKQDYSQFQSSDATPTKKKDNDYSQKSYQTGVPYDISECGPKCIEDAQSSDATPTKKKDNDYSQENYQTELPYDTSGYESNSVEDAQYVNYPTKQQYSELQSSSSSTPTKSPKNKKDADNGYQENYKYRRDNNQTEYYVADGMETSTSKSPYRSAPTQGYQSGSRGQQYPVDWQARSPPAYRQGNAPADEDNNKGGDDEENKDKLEKTNDEVKTDSINMLSVVISSVMLLAAEVDVPRNYANWTVKYLKCIKTEERRHPENVSKVLKKLCPEEPRDADVINCKCPADDNKKKSKK